MLVGPSGGRDVVFSGRIRMDTSKAMALLGFSSSKTFEQTEIHEIQSAFMLRVHSLETAPIDRRDMRAKASKRDELRKVNEAYQYLTKKQKKFTGRTMTENWQAVGGKSMLVQNVLNFKSTAVDQPLKEPNALQIAMNRNAHLMLNSAPSRASCSGSSTSSDGLPTNAVGKSASEGTRRIGIGAGSASFPSARTSSPLGRGQGAWHTKVRRAPASIGDTPSRPSRPAHTRLSYPPPPQPTPTSRKNPHQQRPNKNRKISPDNPAPRRSTAADDSPSPLMFPSDDDEDEDDNDDVLLEAPADFASLRKAISNMDIRTMTMRPTPNDTSSTDSRSRRPRSRLSSSEADRYSPVFLTDPEDSFHSS